MDNLDEVIARTVAPAAPAAPARSWELTARRGPVDPGPAGSGGPTRSFLAERERVERVSFQVARGYWSNTYLPGDPELRRAAARLQGADAAALLRLPPGVTPPHRQARRPAPAVAAPTTAALAVRLQADRRGLDGRSRVLVAVELVSAARRGARRPPLELALVLDRRGEGPAEVDPHFRVTYATLGGSVLSWLGSAVATALLWVAAAALLGVVPGGRPVALAAVAAGVAALALPAMVWSVNPLRAVVLSVLAAAILVARRRGQRWLQHRARVPEPVV